MIAALSVTAAVLVACATNAPADSARVAVSPTAAAPSPAPTSSPKTGKSSGLVFSPYKDVEVGLSGDGDAVAQTTVLDGTPRPLVGPGLTLQSALPQLKTVTLSFATGECGSESWNGIPGQVFADANVPALAAAGYQYIISAGGATDSFLCSSAAGMSEFIDRYVSDDLIGIDFDIERGESEEQIRALQQSVAAVQDRYPDLRFSFTVASLGATDGSFAGVNPTGDAVIRNVIASGLRNYTINLMVMNVGGAMPSGCVVAGDSCDLGATAIQAVENLRHTYPVVPLDRIELTPMIGKNEWDSQLFTLQDVDEMTAYAVQNGLAGLHPWSIDRDTPCAAGAISRSCSSMPDVPVLGYTQRFLADLGRL
ncbi:hypothetical protein ABCS02_12585 [Microbacterium sp. X-17]|uniref:hypothetical protein n=1 Tax=Microbacterium sp. X-17 TaxID=3144404 RepID=UPI0031F4C352